MREKALSYLDREHGKNRIAITHASEKPNVTQEELENLYEKGRILRWLMAVAEREGKHGG